MPNRRRKEEIVDAFNDLYRTAPLTMRNPLQAKLWMRQYMTQGGMVPNEILPAMTINKMFVPYKRLREEV